MNFNEKLDFLMNITKTKNSDLAMYTSLDSSYISRLRRGKRKLSKSENYVRSMAEYFAKSIKEDYKKKTIFDLISRSGFLIKENLTNTQILYHWLKDEKEDELKVVEGFIDNFSNFQFKKTNTWENAENKIKKEKKDVEIYPGIQGKREGVLNFLSLVLEEKNPQTLLLFSDEDLDWLAGDNSFRNKWKDYMDQIILKGNKIIIIHELSRNLFEMLTSIKEWMPLYMTGAIEPYYYPKKRDGIFRRTIFAAPDTAALTSTVVGNMGNINVNYLVQNKNALKGLETEFNNYLKLCKPLVKIFDNRNRKQYLETLGEFENEEGNTILNPNAISIRTLPVSTAEKIMIRTNYSEKIKTLEYAKTRNKIFEKNIKNFKHTDIVTLPKIEDVLNDNVIINFSNLLGIPPVTYKKDELIEHLENILNISQKYENYKLVINLEKSDKELSLYCKEDVGVIASKKEPPFMIFAINESNMTAAFWDYLKGHIESKYSKKNSMKKLSEYIKKIKEI
ncbi:MAG: transcriptional regulator [Eubacteriales bacterium]